jgi:uncharacterized integral membrane protein
VERSTPPPGRRKELPRGRTKTAQAVTIAVLIVALLIGIFVIQNTQSTDITFLFWTVNVPIASALLLAAVAGGALAFMVAYVRQWQFRRALTRERRVSGVAPPSAREVEGPDTTVASPREPGPPPAS